jgi:hypothetical protein
VKNKEKTMLPIIHEIPPITMNIWLASGAITLTAPTHPPEHLTVGNHAFLPKGTASTWDIAAGTVAVIVYVTA